MFTGDGAYQTRSNKANYIHLNARISRKTLSCIPPANTIHHGDQIESLWEHNNGRQGLELSVDPSIKTGWCHSVAGGFPLGKGPKFLMGENSPFRHDIVQNITVSVQGKKQLEMLEVPIIAKGVFLFSDS